MIFQIFNDRLHWKTPYNSIEEAEETHFHNPDCVFVEAPDNAQEGWGYDGTQEGDERFIAPPEIAPEEAVEVFGAVWDALAEKLAEGVNGIDG
jgi:hypothetical protein